MNEELKLGDWVVCHSFQDNSHVHSWGQITSCDAASYFVECKNYWAPWHYTPSHLTKCKSEAEAKCWCETGLRLIDREELIQFCE